MTQVKLSTSQKGTNEAQQQNNSSNQGVKKPWFAKNNYIQALAWILLTLGLCMIVITFYLAISSQVENGWDDKDYEDNEDNEDNFPTDFEDASLLLQFNKSTRGVRTDFWDKFNVNLKGCEEKICKMRCRRASINIYEKINEALNASSCEFMDMLVITRQKFPFGVLKNNWLDANKPIREVFFSSCPINRIRNGAFNADMFSETYLLAWYNLNLTAVDGGALLGLYSLKYLLIDTPMPNFDRALLQPVQTTLNTLKLHAGLSFAKDESIFGVSKLDKLEYLDLSRNNFNGPITKQMLSGAPNIKHMIIGNSKITNVEADAFSKLSGTLKLINLSMNLFTTISADAFSPLLLSVPAAYINLSGNSWTCNCKLKEFAELYASYRSQFMDTLYCKAPHSLYGVALNEVDFSHCDGDSTTMGTYHESDRSETTTKTIRTTTITQVITAAPNVDNSPINIVGDETTVRTVETELFKMRCVNSGETSSSDSDSESYSDGDSDSDSGSTQTLSESIEIEELPLMLSGNVGISLKKQIGGKIVKAIIGDDVTINRKTSQGETIVYTSSLDYFQFDPPTYEFQLQLLGNHSVQVNVVDYGSIPLNIIWFSESFESTDDEDIGSVKGYNCVEYSSPYLIVDDVEQNTTYTFCLMKYDDDTITPFNCLPLHIPTLSNTDDNIWISEDDKPFTIGILCLIFLMSLFFGAVVAYFGIKKYPDLLEGSKNVLVVKKPETNCYVSTISEVEYMKQNSFKKKPQSISMKKKPGLPETPTSTPPPSFTTSMSVKNLERLPSLKSSSTYFEDAFVPISFPEDEYEMPTHGEPDHCCRERCVTNTYATSPMSNPPPLPKRNDSIVFNRFDNSSK